MGECGVVGCWMLEGRERELRRRASKHINALEDMQRAVVLRVEINSCCNNNNNDAMWEKVSENEWQSARRQESGGWWRR